MQLDTVNVAGNQSAHRRRPGLHHEGLGQRRLPGRRRDRSPTTRTATRFARQNGGTNTFFDFSTFQDVEVATGGSLLEQQNSGVTINVVTKRGTNEIKGAARYLYASGNWQSNNAPQEAIDQGLPTNNTRMIREYGADLGGPIIKDKFWLWFAGSYQTISTNPTAFDSVGRIVLAAEATNLEPWSAKLNWQISNANSAQLYYQRSDRDQQNTTAGRPGRRWQRRSSRSRPTSTRSRTRTSSPRTSSPRSSRPTRTPTTRISATAAWLRQRPVQARLRRGLEKDTYYVNPRHLLTTTTTTTGPRIPQKQANVQVSKFFNTGSANHELKFSFNYRTQIADSATGWPGDQNIGSEYATRLRTRR